MSIFFVWDKITFVFHKQNLSKNVLVHKVGIFKEQIFYTMTTETEMFVEDFLYKM